MPPRFAYWTILIDDGATAFRARDAADLLPTLHQLKRKNANVVLKWFSGGRLWDSPEAARNARRRPPASAEKRSAAWRPGGAHADPRDRFRKKPGGARSKPWRNRPAKQERSTQRQGGAAHRRPATFSRRPRRRDDEPPDRD